jgi:hypothetical protein
MEREPVEIHIAFFLLGDPVDPAALTALLGVQADVHVAKGAPRVRSSSGEVFEQPRSVWGFSSEHAVVSNEIDDHFNWLLSKVSHAVEVLRSTSSRTTFIEVVLGGVRGSSFVFPSGLLALVAALDAQVGVVMRPSPVGLPVHSD